MLTFINIHTNIYVVALPSLFWMKVNKNVTLEFDHVQLIVAVMNRERIKNFSRGLSLIIQRAIALQRTTSALETELNTMTVDRDLWKGRYDSHVETKDKTPTKQNM